MATNRKLASYTDEELLVAITKHGSKAKAAKALGIPDSTFKDRVASIQVYSAIKQAPPKIVTPSSRVVKRFIFSSAQDGTEIHPAFLHNLETYAKVFNAQIVISGYTYNKSLYEDHRKGAAAFHPSIEPYMQNRSYDISDRILFCGEMNTLPTAVQPLDGFEAYTRSKWGIFPHPRISLRSIPTHGNTPAKQIMTTGSITLPNYIQKKAGIKAEFHHVIGACLVEIDTEGDVFCRHLLAEKNGSFQDLTVRVEDGKVTRDHGIEAITFGDIHTQGLDPEVAMGSWGYSTKTGVIDQDDYVKSMLFQLSPRYAFYHDVLDFHTRNHHNVWDHHFRFKTHIDNKTVFDEIKQVAQFLHEVSTMNDYTSTIVVDSNHDRALLKWLKHADYRNDPANAIYFLKTQLAVYEAIRDKDESFLCSEYAIRQSDPDHLKHVDFLRNTDSFMICKSAGGGIECAMHGDQGANGAKGNVLSFARMGPKANTADKHAAEIFEGIYQAGHSCKRDMIYNRGGLSSWTPSHIVTYPNGKRTMITMQGTKWCAETY